MIKKLKDNNALCFTLATQHSWTIVSIDSAKQSSYTLTNDRHRFLRQNVLQQKQLKKQTHQKQQKKSYEMDKNQAS